MPWFFLASGIFALVSATLNWSWLKETDRARAFIERLGEPGARGLYLAIGLILTGLGTWMLLFAEAA
ncbi:MAG: Imm17 family immunity protein [Planctomycetota bacterium]|nr:Imm17 family immunity protein [Planctomycetota bacterium]